MDYAPAPFHEDTDVHNVETLTVFAAARRMGVTQSAILRWIRNGYLTATPSSNGWQIPAHMLEEARSSADDARGTGPVPRRANPTLEPTPTPIRRSMETRSVEIADGPPASVEAIGESVVAPLAELIRDQIDVVHDQAEVIGWLQAERARLALEVEKLKTLENQVDVANVEAESAPDQPERREDDALVSLLWKDSGRSEEIDGLRVLTSDETTAAIRDSSPEQATPVEPPAEAPVFDEWFVDNGPAPSIPEPLEERPELRLEDYADPSWFFVTNDAAGFGGQPETARPAAMLKPIVPRSKSTQPATDAIDESHLRRVIDETERKIAQLWQDEEQLRNTQPAMDARPPDDANASADRGSIWQRLWPTRR